PQQAALAHAERWPRRLRLSRERKGRGPIPGPQRHRHLGGGGRALRDARPDRSAVRCVALGAGRARADDLDRQPWRRRPALDLPALWACAVPALPEVSHAQAAERRDPPGLRGPHHASTTTSTWERTTSTRCTW